MKSWFGALFGLVVAVAPAPAVIKKLTPMSEVLDNKIIIVVEVDTVAPEKPAVVFKHLENLKGKSPTEKFIVNLTGDSFAKKDKHTDVMLDRLEAGRKLVLFMTPREDDYIVFGYLEGTWFQMRGVTTEGKTVWGFLHCEPYFRRTFKGSTSEMLDTIKGCLEGKRKPPEPDEKEPHGYGPPLEKKKDPGKKCDDLDSIHGRHPPAGFVFGPLFGVIPSFLLVGPLAVLSALFPSLFAGLASGLKRWRAFLVIASINSILTGIVVLSRVLITNLPDTALLSDASITTGVVLVNLAGLSWAGRRYRRAALEDPAVTSVPGKAEAAVLLGFLAAVAGLLALVAWMMSLPTSELFKMPTRELTAIGVGLAAAAVHSLYRRATRGVDESSAIPLRLSAPGEAVAIAGMLLFTLALLMYDLPRQGAQKHLTVESGEGASTVFVKPALTDATLFFEAERPGRMYSAALVVADRIFVGASETEATSEAGIVLCLDRASGRRLWRYTDKNLKTVYCTPALHEGRLYFGEGLHTDADCRLLCLDAEKGTRLWEKKTTSHTEGTPAFFEGNVYFSAGDDGVYCLDAKTGDEVWHYQGLEQKLHIDTPVVIADGKLFGGSGYTTLAAFCLDARTKKELWRRELPLRSFGSPLVLGQTVVYGLGTGNLTEDLSTEPEPERPKETVPAGQIICLDIQTGNQLWAVDLPKSVHTQLAADARAIYAACRNGSLYALDRKTGNKIWSVNLGVAFTGGPVVSTLARGAVSVAVYASTNEGLVYCLDPHRGFVYWMRTIPDAVRRRAEVLCSPVVVNLGLDGVRRELLVPATLTNTNTGQMRPGIVKFLDEIPE